VIWFVWLECRQPHKLCVAWMRHGRRLCSEVHGWESALDDPYRGEISWSVPENITATVTLFHAGRVATCEDKKWMFVVENVSKAIVLVSDDVLMYCSLLYFDCIVCLSSISWVDSHVYLFLAFVVS